MIAAFLITLREGLEAALVVGLVLGVLRKLGQTGRARVVWGGVISAAAVSLIAGLALNGLGIALQGRGEEVFEAVTMLLAAAMLTWMIFWMRSRGQRVQVTLERDASQAVGANSARALFALSFVAVVREGIETVLFLTAAAVSATPAETLVGGTLGLVVAVVLGWMVFASGRRLGLSTFFRATSFLLILFAAGLLAHGVHALQEARLLPVIVPQVWDASGILSDSSALGGLLRAVFGYNADPSLLEVLSYGTYLAGVWLVSRRLYRASAQSGLVNGLPDSDEKGIG